MIFKIICNYYKKDKNKSPISLEEGYEYFKPGLKSET